MSSVTGLTSVGFVAFYWHIAPKFQLLAKIPLEIQKRAFAVATVAQVIVMHCCFPKENKGFSVKKTFVILAPYLLISTAIYYFHRQALKASIISSLLFGMVQLVAHKLVPIIVGSCAAIFLKDGDQQDSGFADAN